MPTSPIYSSVIDFVWEWAQETGVWAQVLVEKLVTSGGQLSDTDRKFVHDAFLKSIGENVALDQVPNPKKPELPNTCQNLSLRSLSDISGVNQLAPSQTVEFGSNLTVVYGNNGSGKSGYCRILRAVGRGYQPARVILSDVYANEVPPKSAKITYSADGEKKEWIWNDNPSEIIPSELKGVIFFCNASVEISISSNRGLLVTPIGFELFRRATVELGCLGKLHEQLIIDQGVHLDWEGQLTAGSSVQQFLSRLAADTKVDHLESISAFNDEHVQMMAELETEQKEANPLVIENEIKKLMLQKTELETIIQKVEKSKTIFTDEFISSINIDTKELTALNKNQVQSIFQVAKEYGIQFLESDEFRSFLQSAESYLDKVGEAEYPKKDEDRCILCNQVISDDLSIVLLKKYREVLSSVTKSKIEALERRLSKSKEQIKTANIELKVSNLTFGESETQSPVQPECLVTYNSLIDGLHSQAEAIHSESEELAKSISFKPRWDLILQPLRQRVTELASKIDEKREKLTNQKEVELRLQRDLADLKDRRLLNQKKSEVEKKLKSLKTIRRLDTAKSMLNTRSLSQKTTKARDSLIENRLLEGFQEELTALNKPYLKVDLDFETDKGNSKLLQVIEENHQIEDVLSEGEQKAIALCELLAELRLDPTNCPLVLDDPVTSLDHYFIDDIANRLVKLSAERQVIVFTHSILLFNAIKDRANDKVVKNLKLEMKVCDVVRGDNEAGIVCEGDTLREETFGLYEGKVNGILNNTSAEEKRANPVGLAIQGYGHLRAAIEVFVADEVFLGAVKRYRKNVTLTKFEEVNGALIDELKEPVYRLFEKSSGYIEGHSKVSGVNDTPSLTSLRDDFETLKSIRSRFLNDGQRQKVANA